MTLHELGLTNTLEKYRIENQLDRFSIARVISEHKDRFTVRTATAELEAELLGNLRYAAESRKELPVVGDWVAISEYDESKGMIHAVYPRTSLLERKAIGKFGEAQPIAANIDVGLIVLSVNRDFSINRIERYLTICNAAGIEPLVVLTKIDLVSSQVVTELLNKINQRIKEVPVIALSNQTRNGFDNIRQFLSKSKTYCLMGSSGVGKSTLINNLIGENVLLTGEISKSIDRGKHVTTHRELIVTDHGILIDNPGMREVGITSDSESLELTFDEISNLSAYCKFKDCSHTNETGCAVLEALQKGELDSGMYENFQKIERERSFFNSSLEERKQKDKELGKLIKNFAKQRKRGKF